MNEKHSQSKVKGNPRSDRGQLLKQNAPAVPIRESEEDLPALFQLSRDLLCIADFDGYFKRLNPAWTTTLGWSLEELKAQPFLALVHAEDLETTKAEVSSLAKGAETLLFENRYQCKDGSYRWLRWNARPDVSGSGRIYAIARDITGIKRLEREILEILDREKERLGRELHDGLCQSLAGIAALSATLSKRLSADSNVDGSAAASEINKLLNESISDARGLARGLSPIDVDGQLDEALDAMALNIRNMFRVSCTLVCDRPFHRLSPEIEGHLFRIAQEAVNNAVAHGQPENIEISLSSEGPVGKLSVQDDGVGISENENNPEGIGMHTMAYRARLIHASFTVRRIPRGGTIMSCTFPLSSEGRRREEPGP